MSSSKTPEPSPLFLVDEDDLYIPNEVLQFDTVENGKATDSNTAPSPAKRQRTPLAEDGFSESDMRPMSPQVKEEPDVVEDVPIPSGEKDRTTASRPTIVRVGAYEKCLRTLKKEKRIFDIGSAEIEAKMEATIQEWKQAPETLSQEFETMSHEFEVIINFIQERLPKVVQEEPISEDEALQRFLKDWEATTPKMTLGVRNWIKAYKPVVKNEEGVDLPQFRAADNKLTKPSQADAE